MADAPPPRPPRREMKEKAKKGKPKTVADAGDADADAEQEDHFLFLTGMKEGGFLELEELDESEYGFVGGGFVPDVVEGDAERKKNKSKRKRSGDEDLVDGGGGGGDGGGDLVVKNEEVDEEKDGDKKEKKEKRKKKKRKTKKIKRENGESNDAEVVEGSVADLQNSNMDNDDDDVDDDVKEDYDEEFLLGDDEVDAWKELRLHPLLVKAIRRLGFKEPTPIQKTCFPAAAHQGKDVIGAAETGSGKTLAFGLPILQRLLQEREKATRLLNKDRKQVDENGIGSPLRALIVTPTRELAKQVCDHLKEAAKFLDIQVVPIVGGMSSEKQERLLKRRPQIIVGTPGRLWELMSAGDQHLAELHSLSFFVLDEADRMIERGHFHELQSIIDMLPMVGDSIEQSMQSTPNCQTVPILQRKKRQTLVFSATIALSENFRKKLKRSSSLPKSSGPDGLSSIEALSERAGMRPDAEVVDLTNASIFPTTLEESFIECSEEDKDACLYYILSVHGHGRTIVFCTSIAALRHISSILQILGISALTHHAQMQQRARLKSMDRFRGNENAVLVATDGFARGLDIKDVRTVIHYQLPHSADVYIHRSGRTARAKAAGCSIALISPNDKAKFYSLCRSLSKESIQQFPVDVAYMPEVMKRLALARQIDKITRKSSQENAKKSWIERNAESIGLSLETSDSEEEQVKGHRHKKATSAHLKKLQLDLNEYLSRPLQPKTFSHRFLAGGAVSPLLQQQLEELSKTNLDKKIGSKENRRSGLVVIGQSSVEPLQALQNSGQEVSLNLEKRREVRKLAETWKQKKREEKKNVREQKRKERRKAKEGAK